MRQPGLRPSSAMTRRSRGTVLAMAKTPDHPFRLSAVKTLAAGQCTRDEPGDKPVPSAAAQQRKQPCADRGIQGRWCAATILACSPRSSRRSSRSIRALQRPPMIFATSPRHSPDRDLWHAAIGHDAGDVRSVGFAADPHGRPARRIGDAVLSIRSRCWRSQHRCRSGNSPRPDLAELLARLGGESGPDEKRLISATPMSWRCSRICTRRASLSESPWKARKCRSRWSSRRNDREPRRCSHAPRIPETERRQELVTMLRRHRFRIPMDRDAAGGPGPAKKGRADS